MALSDPQSLTINSVAKDLNKIQENGLSTVYSNADGTFRLEVTHASAKSGRVISTVKFTERKIVSNPLDSTNDYDTASVVFKIDRPGYGWTDTQINYLAAGLKAWFDSTMVTKLFGLQH